MKSIGYWVFWGASLAVSCARLVAAADEAICLPEQYAEVVLAVEGMV